MARRAVLPQLTPHEARAWQALVDLGDAARWGLLVHERVALGEIRRAHEGALRLLNTLKERNI